MTRVLSTARSAFLTVAAMLGVFCVIVFALGLLLNVRPAIVISGSMEPTIMTGSLAFAKEMPASEVAVGDVVMISRDDDSLVTHRITKTEPYGDGYSLTLKGDANSTEDASPYNVTTVGKYLFSIPYLGNVATFLQSSYGLAAIVLVVAALVVAFFWHPGRKEEPQPSSTEETKTASGASPGIARHTSGGPIRHAAGEGHRATAVLQNVEEAAGAQGTAEHRPDTTGPESRTPASPVSRAEIASLPQQDVGGADHHRHRGGGSVEDASADHMAHTSVPEPVHATVGSDGDSNGRPRLRTDRRTHELDTLRRASVPNPRVGGHGGLPPEYPPRRSARRQP